MKTPGGLTVHTLTRWLAALAVLTLVAGGAGGAAATTFTYMKVADVATPIPGGTGSFTLIGEPVLVNGVVVFDAEGPNGQRGIYSRVMDGTSPVTVLYDRHTEVPGRPGVFFNDLRAPMLSPGGIAFLGNGAVYSDVGGTLHRVADTTTDIPGGTGTFTSFGSPWVWSGEVVFRANGADSQEGIYGFRGGAGGTLRRIADKTTAIPGGTGTFLTFRGNVSFAAGIPAVDDGIVVFQGSGSGGQRGIYRDVDGVLQVVADTTTPIPGGVGTFTRFDESVLAGNIQNGEITFLGVGADGQQGLYLHDGTSLSVVIDRHTVIAGTTATIFGFGLQGWGFDNGHVSFLGGPFGGGGVYATLGGVLRLVAPDPMVVDGKTIGSFGNYGRGISGNMVAFNVGTMTGAAGFMVADYVVVVSNDPPVAVNDAMSVQEDGVRTVNVLANDSDPDGDVPFVAGFTHGAKGTVSCTAAGACSYAATTANYSGPDSFTYTVSDGRGGTAEGTVNVTITPVDDADVSIAMIASPNPVGRLRPLTYTVVVRNAGPETATKATLSNTLPLGTTFASATMTQGTLKTPAVGGTGTVTVAFPPLAVGATATVTLTVNVTSSAPAVLTNTATVSHTGTDRVLVNNIAKVSVNVTGVGTFVLTPRHTSVAVGAHALLALEWTLPGPSWRELKDLELRVRDGDGDGAVLWVRLTEGTPVLLALRDEKSGHFGAGAAPGANVVLSSKTAKVYLAGTSVKADGPADPSVVMSLDVSFEKKAGGRRYAVEVRARDDLGNAQDWQRAGTLTVTRSHGHEHGDR